MARTSEELAGTRQRKQRRRNGSGGTRAFTGALNRRAVLALRDSFAVQCERGAIRKPEIHVSFTHPNSIYECCSCPRTTDFLLVVVGLCNIFVLQFVVVILLFFVGSEVDLFDLASYQSEFYTGEAAS